MQSLLFLLERNTNVYSLWSVYNYVIKDLIKDWYCSQLDVLLTDCYWWERLKGLRICPLWDRGGCQKRYRESKWHVTQRQKSVSLVKLCSDGVTCDTLVIHAWMQCHVTDDLALVEKQALFHLMGWKLLRKTGREILYSLLCVLNFFNMTIIKFDMIFHWFLNSSKVMCGKLTYK